MPEASMRGSNSLNASRSANRSRRSRPSEIAWSKGKVIGTGGFGTVYVGMDANTGQLIAGKEFNFDVKEQKQVQLLAELEAEIRVMKDLVHENVVQYRGAERRENFFYIFMEYVPGGSLRSLLDQFGPLQPRVASKFTKQVLDGLEFLHGQKVVHRDIKAANVLVNVDSVCKLADFGSSETFEEAKGMKGTPYWMAPEVITGTRKIGWQADIWSLGCMLVEMLTGGRPFAEFDNPMKALMFIANSTDRVRIPDSIVQSDPHAADFIAMCLDRDPHHRPPASALLSHLFINTHNVMESFSFEGSSYMTESTRVVLFEASGNAGPGGGPGGALANLTDHQPDTAETIAQQQMLRTALITHVTSSTHLALTPAGRPLEPPLPPQQRSSFSAAVHVSSATPSWDVGGPLAEDALSDAAAPPAFDHPVVYIGPAASLDSFLLSADNTPRGGLAPAPIPIHISSEASTGAGGQDSGDGGGGASVSLLAPKVMEALLASMRADLDARRTAGDAPLIRVVDASAHDDDDEQDQHASLHPDSPLAVYADETQLVVKQPWTPLRIFRVIVAVLMVAAFAGLIAMLAVTW